MAVRLQLKLGAVTEQDRLPDSPDTVVVVEPSVGSVGRTKGNLYLLVTSRVTGPRAREATRVVADTIRNEYYYDESAGIRQCLTKVLGIANKRLAHQRDHFGLGHQEGGAGPIGVAVAVVRGRELYVATVGPAEAYLIRQARLSTLPDPNGESGLPVAELEPEVWRGELSVGDSLCLVSANVVARVGTDTLKDALVTLHPQSAIEHLHARFVAADGHGSDGAFAFEATEVGATQKARTLVPVRPDEPLAGAPDRSPIPLADSVTAGAAAIGASATRARDAAGNGFQRFVWRIQDRLPHRRRGTTKVSTASSRMETQRRAAVALLAFVTVGAALALGVYAVGGQRTSTETIRSFKAGQQAFEAAQKALAAVSGPGIDLVANDPKRALELLSTAYDELDKAEKAGYPLAQIAPLRQTVLDGLDRLYGVVKVASTDLFTFPAGKAPASLTGLVRGSDGAPYVLDTAAKTVWRIDLAKKTATAVLKSGQKVVRHQGRRPEVHHDRRPGRPGPRLEERALALAARERQGKGNAGQDQGGGLRLLGQRRPRHRHLRRQLRRRVLQALRRRPVRAEHHGHVALQRRIGLPGSAAAATAHGPPGGRDHGPPDRRRHLRGGERGGRPGDPGRGLAGAAALGHTAPPDSRYTLLSSPDRPDGTTSRRTGILYAFDAENHRLVAFNKSDGAYVAQYQLAGGDDAWAGLTGMTVMVSPDETVPPTMWWISATGLHTVTLAAAPGGPGRLAVPLGRRRSVGLSRQVPEADREADRRSRDPGRPPVMPGR